MNTVLERVNDVCKSVRNECSMPTTFKKLVSTTRKTFRRHDFDLSIRSKKDTSLHNNSFYVNAFYDPEDDKNLETSIEVLIHHSFEPNDLFEEAQITEFLIQIYDAVVHEFRHQQQSRKRNFKTYSDHAQEPFSKYLSDPDELDAYSVSIAIELLRVMPAVRAKKFMTKMTILSRMKQGNQLVSPNLRAYVNHFEKDRILRKLAKKVNTHLNSLDSSQIFR